VGTEGLIETVGFKKTTEMDNYRFRSATWN